MAVDDAVPRYIERLLAQPGQVRTDFGEGFDSVGDYIAELAEEAKRIGRVTGRPVPRGRHAMTEATLARSIQRVIDRRLYGFHPVEPLQHRRGW